MLSYKTNCYMLETPGKATNGNSITETVKLQLCTAHYTTIPPLHTAHYTAQPHGRSQLAHREKSLQTTGKIISNPWCTLVNFEKSFDSILSVFRMIIRGSSGIGDIGDEF